MKPTKPLIIISLVTIILISVAGWYLLRPQGTLEFALAPGEMQVTLGDSKQTIQHKQSLKLTPGSYQATFSRDGFDSEQQTIEVIDDGRQQIVIALTPQTEAAKKLLADDPESQAVIQQYQQVKYVELVKSLPLSGVGYYAEACPSIKYPQEDRQAICITVSSRTGEAAAQTQLRQLGYDIDQLELLVGSDTAKTVLETDRYKIEYYTNVESETSNKVSLFVTPKDVSFVPYSTTNKNPKLESIKTAALADLTTNGYQLDDYDIVYSNVYLSQYNPAASEPAEHAMPPIN